MPIRFEFDERKIILTGAAGDIGSRILKGFLESRAKVFATDRAGEHLDALEGPPDHLKKTPCNLTDVADIRQTMRIALEWLGGCDVLLNVAGYMPIRDPLGLSEKDWSDVLGVNLLAPYFAIQETIEALKASSSGRIISFASIAGKMGGIGPMFGQARHFRAYARERVELEKVQYGVNRYTKEAAWKSWSSAPAWAPTCAPPPRTPSWWKPSASTCRCWSA